MADLTAVLADLRAECDELDAVVAALGDREWSRATPAEGWTIAHQIAHLAWTDDVATLAATNPAEFQAELSRALAHFDGYVDRAAAERAQQPPRLLVTTWREGRAALSAALESVPDGTKVPWFGPPMSPTSMASARAMETWAHAQDVFDALEVARRPTDRLRHVAHLGVRTRDFAYLVRERPIPTAAFGIELTGPNGDVWTWGPQDASQRVTGPALDFCLLVTQRRHRDDLALTAEGDDADEWLDIAQAFAGPPGPGRAPGRASVDRLGDFDVAQRGER